MRAPKGYPLVEFQTCISNLDFAVITCVTIGATMPQSDSRARTSPSFPLIFLGAAAAALLGAGAWMASIDGVQEEARLERACAYRFCDPALPSRSADRLVFGGVVGDPERVIAARRLSQLALANDPASPSRWCDLGELYLELGYGVETARTCFRRSEQLTQANPVILQRIANFYFQIGETGEAVQRCYRILQQVREFDEIIYSSYLRFGVTQRVALAQGVPPEPGPVRSFLRFTFAHWDVSGVAAAWQWATTLQQAGAQREGVDGELADSYVSFLWRHGEFGAASRAWSAYLGDRAGDYPRGNRIFNGGFESEPDGEANPLDWRVDAAKGVEIERDSRVRQAGQASLRITFPGTENLDFHQLGQTQPAWPGSYRLRAMVRTEGITTDQGVRLRVFDPEVPARLDVSTAAMTGSSEWHAVELRVEVRAPTRLVRVEVARKPSLKFDSKIAGTLWLDSVSLVPAS
jgi:hypothetical protein